MKTKKNKNGTITSQIIGSTMLLFIMGVTIFVAVTSKELEWIIIACIVTFLLSMLILQSYNVIRKEQGKSHLKNPPFILIFVYGFILVIIGASAYSLVDNVDYMLNGEKTKATIYKIDREIKYTTEYDDEGNSYEEKHETCDLYIKYNVREQEYTGKIESGSCHKEEKDKVTIYYRKDNPEDFQENKLLGGILGIIFGTFGLIIVIINTIKDLKSETKKKRKNKKLKS